MHSLDTIIRRGAFDARSMPGKVRMEGSAGRWPVLNTVANGWL